MAATATAPAYSFIGGIVYCLLSIVYCLLSIVYCLLIHTDFIPYQRRRSQYRRIVLRQRRGKYFDFIPVDIQKIFLKGNDGRVEQQFSCLR